MHDSQAKELNIDAICKSLVKPFFCIVFDSSLNYQKQKNKNKNNNNISMIFFLPINQEL